MRHRILGPVILLLGLAAALPALEELQTGPPLPYHVVRDWAQLPAGWNFGEVSAVVRGPHPVFEFDKSGKLLRAWPTGMSGPWTWTRIA